MTFESVEISQEDGQPFELLKVTFLDEDWCYTTLETPVTYDGKTYTPTGFSHGNIQPTSDAAKASLDIKLPMNCPVGELYRAQSPSGVVSATLFAKHVGEDQVAVIWKGRIKNVMWEEPWLTLTCESAATSMKRVGARRKYAMQCPLALYEQGTGQCNVDRELFKHIRPVTGINGNIITVSPNSVFSTANYFAGGYVTWTNSVTGKPEMRMVRSSDSSGHVEIPTFPNGLAVGANLTLFAGCDHSLDMCASKFGNHLNYGGQPFIPLKNPFNGSTLY